jgi:hypothetical protein
MCAQRTYYGAFVVYYSNETELQSTCSSCQEQLHAKSNPLNTQANNNYFKLCTVHFFCMYNEQTNAHLIDGFHYSVLYLSPLHVSTPTLLPQGAVTQCL